MSDWFLPASRRPWTTGNLVTPLVHGATYFRRLVEVIGATAPGDLVYLTDWRGDADEQLTPTGPTVGELLESAARRGVTVRALLWRSHSDRASFSAQENQHLGRCINDAGGVALLDQRVRRGGSHHQKIVVVQHASRPGDDVAFVGGIDLSHGRRDDERHAGDPQQQPMDDRYGDRAPWHDAMAEIRGPAVRDVAATFVERWNDPTPLDHRDPYRATLQRAADMPRDAPSLPDPSAPPPAGSHRVQILRTYGCKRHGYPFARRGERTVADAYAHAFSRARRFIYVEDQYLWSPLVARALAEALVREPALQAVVVVPRFPDDDGRLSGPPNRLGQIEALQLLSRAGGDRFGVYDLENAAGVPIYVHAKICIVDDEWLTIGSDNFNRRSWTHDSEATCAVVDEEGRLAAELRCQLWSEHLGVDADDRRLLDPHAGALLWRERAGALDDWHAAGAVGARPAGQARAHRPDPVSRLDRVWATPLYRVVFDPDGRPLGMRLRRGV